jgi:hypothetical protein
MKNYLLILLAISSTTLLLAEPTFDASSGDAIGESSKAMIEAIKENPDLGMQDKGAMASAISARLMQSVQYILEKGGPNASDRQQEDLMVEFLSKYDGMTAAEFFQAFIKEEKEKNDIENSKRQAAAMAQAEKEKQDDLAKQAQKNKVEEEMQSTLLEWLNGKPATLLKLANNEGVIVEYDSANHEISAKIERWNNEGKLATTYNSVISGKISSDATTWEGDIYIDKEYIPAACRYVNPSDVQNIFWWAPKFKEWAVKVINMPESERPNQYVKEIPMKDSDARFSRSRDLDYDGKPDLVFNTGGPSTVFFVYDKKTGPGVWVMGDEPVTGFSSNHLKSYEFVKNALESGEIINLKYHHTGTDFHVTIEQAQKFGMGKLNDFELTRLRNLPEDERTIPLQGRFYDMKAIYLAGSSVNNFLSKVNDIANEKENKVKDQEKAKNARDEIDKKLNLD